MIENISINESLSTGINAKSESSTTIILGRAEATIEHYNQAGNLLNSEKVFNLITNSGRVQYHIQCFGTTGLATNGHNYIALSADAVSETASSTVLSNEITGNGFARAQGTVVLPTGSGTQTTISKIFTATGSQSVQKLALFNASSSGIMNHVLGFTSRSLISGDTLSVVITITLS